jgi:hypothetical protein
MSTVVHPKGHRHSRSAVLPPNAASPHNPQSPYHLGLQAQAQHPQPAMDYSAQLTTPPRTPRRENGQASSQNKGNSSAPEAASKQKSRNKKPKNVLTSPAPNARNGHNTPATAGQSNGASSSAKPISTPAAAAYAGPTFHASPAPSALPIPSFYSKSVPDSPGIKGMKAVKEPSSAGSSTPPSVPVSHLQFQREESPLDIFFKADREEKARARSASSSQTAAVPSGPFQPPPESTRASQTPPASTNQSRLRHTSKMSASGIFAMELDGSPSPGSPYGPAFSTPYSERINAARSSEPHQTSSDPSIKAGQQTPSSEALKAYLFAAPKQSSPASSANPFGGSNVASSAPPAGPTEHRNAYPSAGPRGVPTSSLPQANNYPATKPSGRPSSGLRQEVTPTKTPTKTPDRNANNYASTTPSRTYQQRATASNFASIYGQGQSSPLPPPPYSAASGNNSGDLKGMEDNLRKMLKLDSTGGPGASGQNIDRVPATAVPIPSYVGSRAPLQ